MDQEELQAYAEALIALNFFIVDDGDEIIFIGSRRNERQVEAIGIILWRIGIEQIADALDEFETVYCPELNADYKDICELIRDLKVADIVGLSK